MARLGLFSVRSQTLLDSLGCWAASQRLPPQRMSVRPLSLSRMDQARHQEPPRKKLLSEKKLVRPLGGDGPSQFLWARRVYLCPDTVRRPHTEPAPGPEGCPT